MRKILRISLLIVCVCSFCRVYPQKYKAAYEQQYREAEILENNAIYDIAKSYYVAAYNVARKTGQHKNIQNKIKDKILKMDCYENYFHLLRQAEILELNQDFESAEKYLSDAVQYADYENLEISNIDSVKQRLHILAQTKQLCNNLNSINFYNETGRFTDAKLLFTQLNEQSSYLHYYWRKFGFQDAFIHKFDSIRTFLVENRNVSQQYRDVFYEDFSDLENHFFYLIDKTAFQKGENFESDVAFMFFIDTNGVESRQVSCSHNDKSFNDSLSAGLNLITFRQPYRYGFSLPTNDVLTHHVVSSKKIVQICKKNRSYHFNNEEIDNKFRKDISKQMSDAPVGTYFFNYHKNEIDGRASVHLELLKGKGSKAKKWAKNNPIEI